jgi:ABC-type sugar transport system ATPase subunit
MADRIMVLRDGRIIDVIVNENPADIEDTEI